MLLTRLISHRRYASSDTSIAKVDRKGRITGISAGSCIVYVYAQNGYTEKVKVNVSDSEAFSIKTE